MDIFNQVKERNSVSSAIMSLEEYLNKCKEDPKAYASPYQRLLNAIGEPEVIDTSEDPQLSKIFQNRPIKRYKAFSGFFGMETTIERIVNFFKSAAQGLEESNQILYFLGPVGGGKSSLAERIKFLMEKESFYAIKDCPVHCSPLNIFDPNHDSSMIEEQFNIPVRYLKHPLCPHCRQRMMAAKGEPTIFQVEEVKPSRDNQCAIAKTEPADASTQDISTLVGKVNASKLGEYDQADPRAYSFNGGLNKANRGVLDFVEMFKAPIKTLNPLLTATQEGNYMGTEGFSAIPWDGIIVAHSNESEWQTFRGEKKNEAFLDRICLVRVPYALAKDNVIKIYEKLISNSELEEKPCAPGTLEMLADWTVLTCMTEPENSNIYTKLKVYNGETLKDTDPSAHSITEYRDDAGINEGMTGMSTRFAFKILSATFNHDPDEIAANPIYLMHILHDAIIRENLNEEKQEKYLNFIEEHLRKNYIDTLEKQLQTAYLESYSEYGQNLFDRYFVYADAWIQDHDYRDPDTGEMYNREHLNSELEKLENPAGIANPKDFRNEIVNYVLRYKGNNDGNVPQWNSYEKIKEVIESRMFSKVEDLLPVISIGKKASEEEEKKHSGFKARMIEEGYTEKQINVVVEWYMRAKKN